MWVTPRDFLFRDDTHIAANEFSQLLLPLYRAESLMCHLSSLIIINYNPDRPFHNFRASKSVARRF